MDLRSIKEFIKDTFKYILVVIVILLLIVYVITLNQIIGPSMNSTLNDGDLVIIDKIIYRLYDIKRNEIIAFKNKDTKLLVKRIIGLPGETIEYKNNILYINGVKYKEKFLDKNTQTDDFSLKNLGYDIIPDNMYLVLGDNRGNSMDSRTIGLINKSDIIGKIVIRFWPLNQIKIVK